MAVIVGEVEPFPGLKPDKAQALKPLEEASEVFGAWQLFTEVRAGRDRYRWSNDPEPLKNLLDEIADTIQACCNLAHALGCDDLRPYLADIEDKNRKRGRYENKR